MAQEHGSFIVLSPQPEFFPQGGVLAPRLDTLRGKTIAFWITTSSNRTTAILICWGICCRTRGCQGHYPCSRNRSSPAPPEKRCSNPS